MLFQKTLPPSNAIRFSRLSGVSRKKPSLNLRVEPLAVNGLKSSFSNLLSSAFVAIHVLRSPSFSPRSEPLTTSLSLSFQLPVNPARGVAPAMVVAMATTGSQPPPPFTYPASQWPITRIWPSDSSCPNGEEGGGQPSQPALGDP